MRITNKVNYFQFHQPTSGSFGKGFFSNGEVAADPHETSRSHKGF